ncbi:MAG: AMP-binding protein [Deltaproteobacteria bacterium]|nr:AMP-binding protein [Deltaproteobacteria bacterium]
MNVADGLRLGAEKRPAKIALRQGEVSFTYAQLNERVNRLANGLLSLGVKIGTIVGVIPPSSYEHLECRFALGRIGAVALPLDNHWGSGEVRRSLDHFDAEAAIFNQEKTDIFQGIKDSLPKLKGPLIRTGDPPPEGIIDYQELVEGSSPDEPSVSAGGDDAFLIGLSSGTTGLPKGALISHGNMIARWQGQMEEMGFNEADIFLNVTPMHHGGGRSFSMCHLFTGASLYILGGRFDPRTTMEIIARERITTCFMVPTMYHRILQMEDLKTFDTGSLRVLITSGAPLHLSLLKRIVEEITPNLYNYYATVDGGGISLLKPGDILSRSESVGRALFNTEIKVVDDQGQEVPQGTTGEVIYRGPGTAQSYYKNAPATKECFREGWFAPGDLARRDEEGFLYIVGRKKDMIIRGGANIYPPEIEEVLSTHPAVDEAAVAGIPDEEYGEEIAAFLVLKPGRQVTPEEIVAFCKERLAPYKRPKVVKVLASLPKASSGKVVKREVVADYLKNRSSPTQKDEARP